MPQWLLGALPTPTRAVTSTASVNPAEFLGFTWYVSSDSTLYSDALFVCSLASL